MSLELQLLILALEAALYPTLLAAVVVFLQQPKPRRLLAIYLAGGMTISILAGCAIVYVLQNSGTVDGSGSAPSVAADLVVGVLALVAALAIHRHADERMKARRQAKKPPEAEPGREPWSQRMLAGGSAPLVFLAALVLNLPGAAYLIALKDIAAAGKPAGEVFGLILGFNVIMFMLAEIPLAGLIFAPERTGVLVGRFNAWLSRNGRAIAVTLCAVLGSFLVARGLINA
jgi:Sap-like sulfolipid-1-addressing protein